MTIIAMNAWQGMLCLLGAIVLSLGLLYVSAKFGTRYNDDHNGDITG